MLISLIGVAQTDISLGGMLGQITSFPTQTASDEFTTTVSISDLTGIYNGSDVDTTWVLWKTGGGTCNRYIIDSIGLAFSGEVEVFLKDLDGGGNPSLGFVALLQEQDCNAGRFIASGGDFTLQSLNQCITSYYAGGCASFLGSSESPVIDTITEASHTKELLDIVYYDNAGNLQLVNDTLTFADVLVTKILSDSTYIVQSDGFANIPSHGLTVGEYYESAHSDGQITSASQAVSHPILKVTSSDYVLIRLYRPYESGEAFLNGVITNIEQIGDSLQFTGTGDAFNGTIRIDTSHWKKTATGIEHNNIYSLDDAIMTINSENSGLPAIILHNQTGSASSGLFLDATYPDGSDTLLTEFTLRQWSNGTNLAMGYAKLRNGVLEESRTLMQFYGSNGQMILDGTVYATETNLSNYMASKLGIGVVDTPYDLQVSGDSIKLGNYNFLNAQESLTGKDGYVLKLNESTGIIDLQPSRTIITNTVAPSVAPTNIGDIYIDTSGGSGSQVIYMAAGTSASTDWIQISN